MQLSDFLKKSNSADESLSKIYLLVDQMNIYIRGFAVSYGSMQNSLGQETGAIYLFLNQLFSTLKFLKKSYPNSQIKPMIIGELGKPTRSINLYEQYKLDRKGVRVKHRKTKTYLSGVELIESRDAFSRQLRVVREFLSVWSPTIKVDNVEADVVLATTLSILKERDPEALFVIYSGDKDLFQLNAEKENVKIINPVYNKRAFVSKTLIWNKLGFEVPNFKQIPYGRALIGDPSDNIPGIRDFGPARVKNLFSLLYDDMKRESVPLNSSFNSEQRIKTFAGLLEKNLDKINDKNLARLVTRLLDEQLLEYQVYYRLIDLDTERISQEEYPTLLHTLTKEIENHSKQEANLSEAFRILFKEGITSVSESDLRLIS